MSSVKHISTLMWFSFFTNRTFTTAGSGTEVPYMGHDFSVIPSETYNKTVNKSLLAWKNSSWASTVSSGAIWPVHENHTPHTELMVCSWLSLRGYQLWPRILLPDDSLLHTRPQAPTSLMVAGEPKVCSPWRSFNMCNLAVLFLCSTNLHSGSSIQLVLLCVYSSISLLLIDNFFFPSLPTHYLLATFWRPWPVLRK